MSNVGFATLTVIPSAKGFAKTLDSGVQPGMKNSGKAAGMAMGGSMLGGFKGILGPLAAAASATAVVGFLGSATNAASDLGETAAKAGQIFGEESLPALQKFAKGASTALGQSEQEALNASTTFGVFGKSAGLAGDDLVGFSTDMTVLAGDLASFGNTTPQQAIDALGSALRGEAEPMRQFGVLLDDATLKSRAMAMGIITDTKTALTPQQKVLAAQAEILHQTSDAQGDFARTSDGLANQQRILGATWENAKTSLGQIFLPLVTSVVTALNTHMVPAIEAVKGGFATFGTAVAPIMETVKGAVAGLFALFSGAPTGDIGAKLGLAPGSPILTTIETVRAGFTTAFTAITSFIETVVVPKFALIKAAIDNLVATVLPIVMEFVNGMLARLMPLMPQIEAIFKGIGTTISLALDLIKAVITTVTAAISWAWDNWGQSLMNTIAVVWKAILNVIQPAIKTIQSVIRAVLAALKGDWTGAWNHMKSALSSAWDTIKAVVKGAIDIVKAVISNAMTVIKTTMGAAWDAVKSKLSDTWNGIKTAVSNGIDGVVSFIAGLPGRALSALGNIGSSLVSAGSDLIGGFLRGVTNAAGNIVSTIRNTITDKIPAFVKDALGIRSPSRVFMALGVHTANGMAIGIAKGARAVQKAADGLLPSTDYSLTAGVTASGGGYGGGYGSPITVIISPRDLDGLRSIEHFVQMARQQSRQEIGVTF